MRRIYLRRSGFPLIALRRAGRPLVAAGEAMKGGDLTSALEQVRAVTAGYEGRRGRKMNGGGALLVATVLTAAQDYRSAQPYWSLALDPDFQKVPDRLVPVVLEGQASTLGELGAFAPARRAVDACLACQEVGRRTAASAYVVLAEIERQRGDWSAARVWLDRADLETPTGEDEGGDGAGDAGSGSGKAMPWPTWTALFRGALALDQADLLSAEAYLAAVTHANSRSIAESLRARVAVRRGAMDQAGDHLANARRTQGPRLVATALADLVEAQLRRKQGDAAEAESLLVRAGRGFATAGTPVLVAETRWEQALVARDRGDEVGWREASESARALLVDVGCEARLAALDPG